MNETNNKQPVALSEVLDGHSGRQQSSPPSPQLRQRAQTLVTTYSTPAALSRQYSPARQQRCAANAYKAVTCAAPRLQDVATAWANGAELWLMVHLYELGEFAGVREKMTSDQVRQTAAIIAGEFYFLKLTELMLFFQRVKAGSFGRFYGTVDPMEVCLWLRQWVAGERARIVAAEERAQRRRRDIAERLALESDRASRGGKPVPDHIHEQIAAL